MNTISKKLLTGTLAAAVLFGAAGWMQGSFASAEDSANTSTSAAATEETTTPESATDGTTKSFEGRGHHRHGGHGQMGMEMGHHGRYATPEDLATILGITEEELRTEREAGKTLVEIAEAKGITEDELINALKDGLTDELKDFVNGIKPAKPVKPTTDSSGSAETTTSEVKA